ncbi:heavy-metal-associated domain-containing protein [Galbibacter pacificus]|uniref:Heavy-metal-associated domain-containing protein n=1 Tax=Galbibacter pacificus TaxID=2996052 RepID=A0ABT6FUU1_9FLAO|nr:heavy-metal-associated domain-containing protein [Galbibacter pacificus]MDG3583497.1 heavy-metal-associated domain-containing protein [Galbibacter pacificus]MDG3587026.1 heavy-metal-associated domain-containing protein [Galbibacter pacificus]
MKQLIIILTIVMSVPLAAQDKNKKEVFTVSGNCAMCQKRIEKAAIEVKGVKYASWDIPNKELTIIMDERKCNLDDVKKAIAHAGHDTELYTAADDSYNSLPPCCLYRDPESIKMEHHK